MHISIINCTPHIIAVRRDLYDPNGVFGVGPNPLSRLALRGRARLSVYEHLPSGIRLAADAITSGPAFGCSVKYHPSDEAIREMVKLKRIFSEHQGSRHIVLASEISCRTMADHVFDETSATSIEMMWPVLAHESRRLPMAERWADNLACLAPTSRSGNISVGSVRNSGGPVVIGSGNRVG